MKNTNGPYAGPKYQKTFEPQEITEQMKSCAPESCKKNNIKTGNNVYKQIIRWYCWERWWQSRKTKYCTWRVMVGDRSCDELYDVNKQTENRMNTTSLLSMFFSSFEWFIFVYVHFFFLLSYPTLKGNRSWYILFSFSIHCRLSLGKDEYLAYNECDASWLRGDEITTNGENALEFQKPEKWWEKS